MTSVNKTMKILPLSHDQDAADRRFWKTKTPNERLAAMEVLRRQYYLMKYGRRPRFQRILRVFELA